MYLASISPDIDVSVKVPNISRTEKNKSLNIDDLLTENNKEIESVEEKNKELNDIKDGLIKEVDSSKEDILIEEEPKNEKIKVVQVIPVNNVNGGK